MTISWLNLQHNAKANLTKHFVEEKQKNDLDAGILTFMYDDITCILHKVILELEVNKKML